MLLNEIHPYCKNRKLLAKLKVMVFMGTVEYKKYPKAVWNSITKEQQMKVRKLCEQQGIKPAVKMTSADTRIAALEAKLGVSSQPKEGNVKNWREKLPKNQHEGETEGICGNSPSIG